MNLSDPVFASWVERARGADILPVAQRLAPGLRRNGRHWTAACPVCGGRDRDEFAVTPDNPPKKQFFCRKAGKGGDIIDMVRHVCGFGFTDAVQYVTGEPPPGGGRDRPAPDPLTDDMQRDMRDDRRDMNIARLDEERARRQRGEETAESLFARGERIMGTPAADYLRRRKMVPSGPMVRDLRFVPALDYFGFTSHEQERPSLIATLPAMVAAIRDHTGRIIAAHCTFLDPDGGGAWRPPEPRRRNPKKKVQGPSLGGLILLDQPAPVMAIGEGIETTVSWQHFGVGPTNITVAAGVSLSNLAGSCAGTISHPTARDGRGDPVKVPNGEPDLTRPGIVYPEWVEEIIFLVDGDSEPVATRLKMLAAGRRARAQGKRVAYSLAPSGQDFNDLWVEAQTGRPGLAPPTIIPFVDFEAETLALARAPFVSRFGAKWFHEVGQTPPKRDWLVKNLLLARTFGIAYGPPGSGKSFLIADMALRSAAAVVDGGSTEWFGYKARAFGVVYVVAEGRDDFDIRLHAWRNANDFPEDRIIPFVSLATAIDMRTTDADTKALAAEIKALSDQMRERTGVGAELVVIDTVARVLAGGNENASETMSGFVKNCGLLQDELGVAVLGVHHGGKEPGRGPRGHESLHGAADFEFEVQPAGEGEPNRWTVRKLKAGPAGQTYAFRLNPVTVGRDDDGDAITSCVVISKIGEALSPRAKRFIPSQTELEFLLALQEAVERQGVMPPFDLPVGPNVALVVKQSYVRDVYMSRLEATEAGPPEQVDERLRARWSRAVRSLQQKRITDSRAPYMWFTGRAIAGVRVAGASPLDPPSSSPSPVPEPAEPSDLGGYDDAPF